MRGVITSFGSIGDVHPLIALACELRKEGHELTFVLPPNLAAWVQRYGFATVNMGTDLSEVQRQIMQVMSRGDFSFEQMEALLTPYKNDLPAMFEVLERMCEESDFLLSISSFPLAHIVYETTNIPFICVDLESVHGGPNSFTAPLEQQIAALVNPFRRQLGLPAVEYPLSLDAYSPDLMLFATSRQFMSPSRNWPANSHITGFLFLDEDNWTPDQALLDFLEAGEPPILVNFGSTAHADPTALASLIFAMIEQIGCRAIIQRSWTDLTRDQRLPPTIHAVGFVSHAWLFPRTACLICHGGTQTAASALRHGVPLLCVPHTWEHLPSALLVRGFQAGLVVPYEQLSVERIVGAVKEVIMNPAYRQAVHTLSKKIQAEDGLGKAVHLIREFLSTVDA